MRNVLGAAARVGRAEELLHNPIAALQLVWRLVRVWPKKVKALKAHRQSGGKTSPLSSLPEASLRSLPPLQEQELEAAVRGVLSIQHYHNISCGLLAVGFGSPQVTGLC